MQDVSSWKLKKTIVLVGMMGAGKTAVGKALAASLDVPFLDSDTEIEAAANMTISEIFNRDGEAFFRDRETKVIDRLLDREPHCVLSTGGGVFLSERNRKLINEKGLSLWLKADLELLWSRVKHKDTRPLLRTDNPKKTLNELYDARDPFYRQAHLMVQSQADYSVEKMAKQVLNALTQSEDVLEKVT